MRHGFMCNAEELVRLSRFKSIISTRLAVTMICFGISTIIILSTEPFGADCESNLILGTLPWYCYSCARVHAPRWSMQLRPRSKRKRTQAWVGFHTFKFNGTQVRSPAQAPSAWGQEPHRQLSVGVELRAGVYGATCCTCRCDAVLLCSSSGRKLPE